MTIGYASGKIPQIPANILLLKSASLIGVWWGNYAMSNPAAFFESITGVLKGVGEGKIRPYVGKTFPLDQVRIDFSLFMQENCMSSKVIN